MGTTNTDHERSTWFFSNNGELIIVSVDASKLILKTDGFTTEHNFDNIFAPKGVFGLLFGFWQWFLLFLRGVGFGMVVPHGGWPIGIAFFAAENMDVQLRCCQSLPHWSDHAGKARS